MKKRVRIAPSLLSADFSEIGRQTEALEKVQKDAEAKYHARAQQMGLETERAG